MLCEKAASMIVGISMDQKISLIHGQVSLNLLYRKKKTSLRIYVVRWQINEKTADIQAKSFMARTLAVNGKECQPEGEAKVVT